ncbi:hypothetical protein IMZ48_47730 [Candidatus Bathyarchaeota archaeon]|nr:hypothetical protein [Candidatus Bathyarchaeota archaeon]
MDGRPGADGDREPVSSGRVQRHQNRDRYVYPLLPLRVLFTAKPAGECNNSTAFPGIGLGVVLSRPSRLSQKMVVAASKALAAKAPALQDPNKPLLPDVEDVRELSVGVAKAVIQTAVEEGLAREEGIPRDEDELEEWIRVQMWRAEYRDLKKV